MGLGLPIARDLVQAHNGELKVQSAPGQGSQFTIRLPLEHGDWSKAT
jgi:signal transduction histidine kinase